MCQKANMDLRQLMTELKVYRYEVAEKCGVATPTLIQWMQRPLEGEKRRRVITAINAAAAEFNRE